MTEGEAPRDLSPTASRWFAFRRWHDRHPWGAWGTVIALIGLVRGDNYDGRLSGNYDGR